MNKPVKLPEIRKEVFTKARESLGLSTKDLSGMACLSVRQIEQIENGESSSFYGAQVKVTAAKKVAGLLKLKEEDVFDYGEVAPAPKSTPEKVSDSKKEKNPEANQEVSPEKKVKPSKAGEAKKVESGSEQVAPMKTLEPIGSLDSAKTAKQVDSKKKLFLILGIAAALVFSIVNLRPLFFPEPPKEEIVVVEEVVKEPEPEAKPEAKAEVKEDKTDAANKDAAQRFVVQVGAFADEAKSREVRAKLEKAGFKTYTHVADTKEGKRTRVRVGPFTSRDEADKAASKIKQLQLQPQVLTL